MTSICRILSDFSRILKLIGFKTVPQWKNWLNWATIISLSYIVVVVVVVVVVVGRLIYQSPGVVNNIII